MSSDDVWMRDAETLRFLGEDNDTDSFTRSEQQRWLAQRVERAMFRRMDARRKAHGN